MSEDVSMTDTSTSNESAEQSQQSSTTPAVETTSSPSNTENSSNLKVESNQDESKEDKQETDLDKQQTKEEESNEFKQDVENDKEDVQQDKEEKKEDEKENNKENDVKNENKESIDKENDDISKQEEIKDKDQEMMDVDSTTTTTTTSTTGAPKTPTSDESSSNIKTHGDIKILPKTLAALTQPIQDDQIPPYLVSNKEDIDITQTNLEEPRDARVIKNILKTMGVQSHDPRVVNQLLEFMFKYVYEVLQDAVVYSEHSGRSDVDISDIRLSIQSRVNFSFTQPPPRELLLSISEERNKIPLPPIPHKFGVLLPPDEYCLTYPNYQVDPPKPQVQAQPAQTLHPPTQRGHYNKKIPEKQIPIRLTATQPPSIVAPPINGKHLSNQTDK